MLALDNAQLPFLEAYSTLFYTYVADRVGGDAVGG